MPDVTDQILSETIPDPHYYPLSPSVEDILTYKQELESEGRGITIEWATSEIKNHLLNWVRVGLVADVIRRYRLYKDKFARWQDYCQEALGKSVWQVKRIINAAKVVIELAEAGFEQLPTCEAQASKLVRYLDQSSICPNHQTLYDKWKQVISRLPKHQITGDKIDEELGHLKPARKRINVTREVAEQLEQEATLSGVKTNQLLKELLEERENSKDLLFGLNPKLRDRIFKEAERDGLTIEEVLEKYFPEDETQELAEEDKNVQTCTVKPQKIKRWLVDLEDLIKSHEREIWLACMLLKLSPWQLVPL